MLSNSTDRTVEERDPGTSNFWTDSRVKPQPTTAIYHLDVVVPSHQEYGARHLSRFGLIPLATFSSLCHAVLGPPSQTNDPPIVFADPRQSSASTIGIVSLVGTALARPASASHWPNLPTFASYVEIDALSDVDEIDEMVREATARIGWR